MTLEIHLDRKKDYRWRLRARNGRILAESGEGYKRKKTMMRVLDQGPLYAWVKVEGYEHSYISPLTHGKAKRITLRDLTK